MRGRKPTPTALHVLRGNPGRRHRHAEPTPPPAAPTPPDWLSPPAALEWQRLAPVLARVGVLTATDVDALAAYCEAFVTWQQATTELRARGLVVKTKEGGPRLSPYLRIADTALAQMRLLLVEFGMTPSARARVRVPQPSAKPASKWGGLL